MKNVVALLGLATVALFCQSANAGVVIDLSGVSTGTGAGTIGDPFVLNAGDSLVINLNLIGLDTAAGETLDYLEANGQFDGGLFGSPVSHSFGSIVPPNEGDLVVNPGSVGGFYDVIFDISASTITANGLFFTFTLTAPSVPTTQDTTIRLTEFSYDLTDLIFDTVTVTVNQELHVRLPGNAQIPEPSSWLVMGLGAVGLALIRRRRNLGPA